MKYIVSGPFRVGGHYLAGLIMSAGQQVFRTHDPLMTLGDDSDTALIMVDRKDRFAAVMSNLIATRTNQTTHYEEKNIEPFYGDEGEFCYWYEEHINYYNRHDFSRQYGRIAKFYYEDFVADPSIVCLQLGLKPADPVTKETHPAWQLLNSRAPYNYRDLVTNHENLQKIFFFLEKSLKAKTGG